VLFAEGMWKGEKTLVHADLVFIRNAKSKMLLAWCSSLLICVNNDHSSSFDIHVLLNDKSVGTCSLVLCQGCSRVLLADKDRKEFPKKMRNPRADAYREKKSEGQMQTNLLPPV
jgi:hypothetical protein